MRSPTKIDSLEILRREGLNPTTIFDVGGGTRGTDCLFLNFSDKRTIIIEPTESHKDTLVDSMMTRGVKDYELVFNRVGIEDTEDTVKLSTIAKEKDCEPSYLIKVDVDGGDLDVCKGCADMLPETDCVIVEAGLQLHAWGRNRSVSSFIEFFNSFDFCLFDMVDALYYNSVLSNIDLIFISKSMVSNMFIIGADEKKDNIKFDRIINENGFISKEFNDYSKKLNVAKKSNTDMWRSNRCI